MKVKPKLITEEAFPAFQALDKWTIYEIPASFWPQMEFLPRHHDLVAVYASGCQTAPVQMHKVLVTAGVDAIAYEPFPKQNSRFGPEPQVNIYHMVFQKLQSKHGQYSYVGYGPFNFGALQEHWPKDEDAALDYYCRIGQLIGEEPREVPIDVR